MPILAFVVNRHNLNSVAVLTGVLEVDPRTEGFILQFLWQDEALMARLHTLAGGEEPLVVALSFSTADLPDAAALMAELRTWHPTPLVIAGGPHPSARPAEVLGLGATAVVVGEGEAVLAPLLERLLAGISPRELRGVATLAADGCLVQGPRPDPVDLDAYPPLSVVHRRFGPMSLCLFFLSDLVPLWRKDAPSLGGKHRRVGAAGNGAGL
jgi:radical SAM superfamily enzyme YgiQ (UPF0313 family)